MNRYKIIHWLLPLLIIGFVACSDTDKLELEKQPNYKTFSVAIDKYKNPLTTRAKDDIPTDIRLFIFGQDDKFLYYPKDVKLDGEFLNFSLDVNNTPQDFKLVALLNTTNNKVFKDLTVPFLTKGASISILRGIDFTVLDDSPKQNLDDTSIPMFGEVNLSFSDMNPDNKLFSGEKLLLKRSVAAFKFNTDNLKNHELKSVHIQQYREKAFLGALRETQGQAAPNFCGDVNTQLKKFDSFVDGIIIPETDHSLELVFGLLKKGTDKVLYYRVKMSVNGKKVSAVRNTEYTINLIDPTFDGSETPDGLVYLYTFTILNVEAFFFDGFAGLNGASNGVFKVYFPKRVFTVPAGVENKSVTIEVYHNSVDDITLRPATNSADLSFKILSTTKQMSHLGDFEYLTVFQLQVLKLDRDKPRGIAMNISRGGYTITETIYLQ